MADHYWTYNAPQHPQSVQWSQDNLLAVAAAHTVVVLHPGDLSGPRGYVAVKGLDAGPLQVGCLPEEHQTSWHFHLAAFTEDGMDAREAKTHIRSLAWSPIGCGPQGGCLLTTVTSDHKVGGAAALHTHMHAERSPPALAVAHMFCALS